MELFGGAIACIVPQTRPIGSILVGDGIRRIHNGLEELDKTNRNNDNGSTPPHIRNNPR